MSRSHPNSWHHLLRGQRYEWPHYTHSSMDEWTWSHLNDRCAWTTELVAEGMCKIGVSHVPSESSELDHLCLLKCNHLTFWSVGAFHLDKQEHSSLILSKPLVSIQSGCRNLQWTGKNPREVRSIKTWRPGEEPYRAWTPPPGGGQCLPPIDVSVSTQRRIPQSPAAMQGPDFWEGTTVFLHFRHNCF